MPWRPDYDWWYKTLVVQDIDRKWLPLCAIVQSLSFLYVHLSENLRSALDFPESGTLVMTLPTVDWRESNETGD